MKFGWKLNGGEDDEERRESDVGEGDCDVEVTETGLTADSDFSVVPVGR